MNKPDAMSGGRGNLPTGLSQPALRALEAAGIRTLEEANRATDQELLTLHGFGPKGLRILRQARTEKQTRDGGVR